MATEDMKIVLLVEAQYDPYTDQMFFRLAENVSEKQRYMAFGQNHDSTAVGNALKLFLLALFRKEEPA